MSPLDTAIEAAGLSDIRAQVEAGERLSFEQGVRLWRSPHLGALGALATLVRERLHGDLTWYNRNLHVNATNVCEASCIFCSFARLETGHPDAWTLSIEQAAAKVRAMDDKLVTEVHTVNGLNPDLPFDYYPTLIRALKAARPDIHVKGFTAVEIDYYAVKYGMSHEEVLRAFMEAGLGSMPGGGAEIFHPRARQKLCHDKVDADGWLEVHRVAHRLGMMTNCTMLFGSIETIEERVDHLVRLRELQDESLAGGAAHFQTFIPLRFHNDNNRLEKLASPTGADSLRTIALSRLMLDNIPHIKAYWVMLGVWEAQLAQHFGASDIDGTVKEEHIYHMAGADTPRELSRPQLVELIRRAGRLPVERDTVYDVVKREDPVVAADHQPMAHEVRLGVVDYTNSIPLTRHLAGGQLRGGHPSEVAQWLSEGEIDLALLPVGALLAHPELRVVPDLCIGCDGPVDSVLIVAETPPSEWKKVLLDGVSRTSVLLARLLLTRGPLALQVSPDLELVEVAPGAAMAGARGNVAGVVIGDVARRLPERLGVVLDLGQQWKEWTGLPFVFAVWAGRRDLDPAAVAHVRAAGLRGVADLEVPAAWVRSLPPEDREYLRNSIRYPLDDRATMGLRRFAALAHQAGLVAHADVSLYPPPPRIPGQIGLADALPGGLEALLDRVLAGVKPTAAEASQLLAELPLHVLGAAADRLRARHHPGDRARWTAMVRIGAGDLAALGGRLEDLASVGGSVVVVEGRTPLRAAVEAVERAGGSARGIEAVALLEGGDALAELRALAAAGLREIEIDGAALLGASGPDLRELLEEAVRLDLDLVGSVEIGRDASPDTAISGLLALSTPRLRRAHIRPWRPAALLDNPGDSTAMGWLRFTALARLLLSPTTSIEGHPRIGLVARQVALQMGADAFGQVEIEAGARAGLSLEAAEAERAIRAAGREPVRVASGQEAPLSALTPATAEGRPIRRVSASGPRA